MIDWVGHMLEAWGRWEVRRVSKGLGWPGGYPAYRQAVGGVVSAENVPLPTDFASADYWRVTTAVAGLPADNRHLSQIVVDRYVRCRTYRQMAEQFGRPPQTVRDYMHAAHVLLAHDLMANV